MTSQQASDQDPQLARIAELEAEVARLKARSEGPDLREFGDSLPVLISYVDRDERYRFNNKAYEDWFGRSRKELFGKHMRDVLGEPAYERLKPLVDRVLAGERVSVETLVPYKDGGTRHVSIEYVPDRRGDAVAGYFALVQDISDRMRTETALRESEARFRRIADSSPVIMWVTRPDRRRDFVNQAYLEFLGLPRDEAAEFDWRQLIHPDDVDRIVAESVAGEASLETFALEGRYRRADGEWRWLRSVSQPRFGPEGEPNGFIGVAHDITDMRRAEAALRESEARFRAMADSAPGLAWVTNREGITFANRALAEFAGRPPDQMLGDAWTTLIHPDDLPAVARLRTESWEKGAPYQFEARFRRGDGEWRWLMVSSRPRQDTGDELAGYVGMAVDITEMHDAADALRASEERYRSLFSSIDAGFCIVEVKFAPSGDALDYRFIEVNPAFEQHTGLKDATGRWARELAPELERHWYNVYGDVAKTGVPKRFELAAAALEDRWFDVYAYPSGSEPPYRVAILFNDISARRRAEQALTELNQSLEQRIAAAIAERQSIEEALRQSQKMEAVGQLTGGIAHDFNNLLTVITGNLELAQRQLAGSGNPRLERNIASALTGAERAAVLTQRLLAFSRRQPLAPKPVDPNKLVGGMSELLHRALGETISVETVLGAGTWRIEIDSNQLENALLNLALNARDAMEQGGKLTIETMDTHLDRAYVAENTDVVPGQYVAICVTDTGIGMDEDTLARAYEPFFTTKEVGKGTGLGLSMVYGFVKQSGGHLKIYSEPGQGTTVKIYLPRLLGDSSQEEGGGSALVPDGSGRETILVCEDDHDVRAYTVEVLRDLGYRVLEAADGPTALRQLEDGDGAIDLLFTDIVLPNGMNGEALARQAREVRPGLKVLFTTGYARNAMMHQGRLDPGVELITKPFAYAELAARLRDMLDPDS